MAIGYALSPCSACGAPADIHLCAACHKQPHRAQHHAILVRQGLARARALGRIGGRPRAISEELLQTIRQALAEGMPKAQVCRVFGVKRTTLYNALAREA
jgi:Helix-turn-helix domain of resolvase